MSSQNKTRLSKGIMDMKFMMKSKVKLRKADDSKLGKEMYHNEITKKMGNNTNFVYESGFVNLEELSVCRYSCRGMNPEIEKVLLNEHISKNALNFKMESDVSGKEMISFYIKSNISSAVNTCKRDHFFFPNTT